MMCTYKDMCVHIGTLFLHIDTYEEETQILDLIPQKVRVHMMCYD